MPTRLITILCLFSCVLLTATACSSLRGPQTPAESSELSAEEPQALPEPQEQVQASDNPRAVSDNVRQLLEGAEAALAADRLTTPLHDNAFDRFQAVLMLAPDNQQARSGLQQVFGRYVGMIRRALARNNPDTARALLERARLVDSRHPMLEELGDEIAALRQRLAEQRQLEGSQGEKEIALGTGELDRRDEAIVEKLQGVANQIKEEKASMLIVARSDEEGRWIYQRMSEAVPDYRLRGDIRLGRVPKILLLPPLD